MVYSTLHVLVFALNSDLLPSLKLLEKLYILMPVSLGKAVKPPWYCWTHYWHLLAPSTLSCMPCTWKLTIGIASKLTRFAVLDFKFTLSTSQDPLWIVEIAPSLLNLRLQCLQVRGFKGEWNTMKPWRLQPWETNISLRWADFSSLDIQAKVACNISILESSLKSEICVLSSRRLQHTDILYHIMIISYHDNIISW